MSLLQLNLINNDTRYTYRQLVQLRRQMLRFAKSIRPDLSGMHGGRSPGRCATSSITRNG